MSVYRFIAARKSEHSVKTMCRVLGVSRSGYHAWQRRSMKLAWRPAGRAAAIAPTTKR